MTVYSPAFPPTSSAAHAQGLLLSYPDNPAFKCSSVFSLGILFQFPQQFHSFPPLHLQYSILLYHYYISNSHIYISNPNNSSVVLTRLSQKRLKTELMVFQPSLPVQRLSPPPTQIWKLMSSKLRDILHNTLSFTGMSISS